MHKISTEAAWFGIVFLIILAIKLIGLWAYGPIMTPDSSGYTAYADIILQGREWLTNGPGRGSVQGFRAIGYPLVLAAMKLFGGAYWMWMTVGLQLAVSLVASVYVFHLAKRLSDHHVIALFAAFCHGVGQTIVLDQCILTDSLNGNLLLILSCHIGLAIVAKRNPSLWEVGALGCLLAAAFLIREAGNYLQYLLWPLIVYWGIVLGAGKVRAVAMLLIFAVPMVGAVQGYKSWNEIRTGERFITTGAQTAMFFPILGLENRGVRILREDELLRELDPIGHWDTNAPMDAVNLINKHLYEEHGFSDADAARYAMGFFFRSWVSHPVDMAIVTLSQLRAKQSVMAFMPVESIVQLRFWATGEQPWPAKGTLWKGVREEGRIDQLALVFGRAVSRGLSMIILLAFLAGVPFYALREVRQHSTDVAAYDVKTSLMFLYWVLYAGYTTVYGLVHLEMRYLMPVEPLSMVAGLVMCHLLWQSYKQRWADKKSVKDGSR